MILLGLIAFALYHYGIAMLQYAGFYVAASLVLFIHGGGKLSFSEQQSTDNLKTSLLLLQTLTGINFIYSALSVKLMTPNLDIAILAKHHAFTFHIPYPEFVFLMLVIEILFGVLFILGWQLRLVSICLLILFIFLSINVSEHILAHSFIYGILSTFILIGGYPLQKLWEQKKFI